MSSKDSYRSEKERSELIQDLAKECLQLMYGFCSCKRVDVGLEPTRCVYPGDSGSRGLSRSGRDSCIQSVDDDQCNMAGARADPRRVEVE